MKKFFALFSLALLMTACGTQQQPNPAPTTPDASILETSPVMEADSTYQLDTAASKLEWEASRLASKPHIGTVTLASGKILTKEGTYVGGEFLIDMTQISDERNSEKFLNHVKSDDFFGVDQFPTSKLVLTNIVKKNDTTYELTGDLTIRDQMHSITFPATIEEREGKILAQSEFQIDRTRWGIIFDSGSFFMELGDRAIKNEITYRLNLVFRK